MMHNNKRGIAPDKGAKKDGKKERQNTVGISRCIDSIRSCMSGCNDIHPRGRTACRLHGRGEPGRDIRVLQITDTQTVDPSQKRWNSRIGDEATEKYGVDPEDERCFRYVREVVASYKPDLILLTGDLVFGEFDDSGEKFLSLVTFMESLDTPWAPIFGNHENESHKGVD